MPEANDPRWSAGYAAGVLASADLGTQVLVSQLQAAIDQQQRVLDEMHETLGKMEQLAAVFRETELGSPYWKTTA